jgi:hypothetical protein
VNLDPFCTGLLRQAGPTRFMLCLARTAPTNKFLENAATGKREGGEDTLGRESERWKKREENGGQCE